MTGGSRLATACSVSIPAASIMTDCGASNDPQEAAYPGTAVFK